MVIRMRDEIYLEVIPCVELVPLEYVRVQKKVQKILQSRNRKIRFQLKYGKGV